MHLEAPCSVLEVHEPRLAKVTEPDDAPGHPRRRGGGQLRFPESVTPGVDLARAVVGTEVVRVRVHSPRPQRLQLLPPDHGLLVVVGHRGRLEVC